MNLFYKSSTTILVAAVLTLSSTIAQSSGSHEGGHDQESDFEAVTKVFGSYDPGMKPTRTVEMEMSDEMRFTPDLVNVKVGDVVLFKHKNNGKLEHEFVLGTAESLDEHAEMMKKFPGMEHSEPYMTHVAPSKNGELIWKFSKAGEFTFGCLIPGHYDAGMKGQVIVES